MSDAALTSQAVKGGSGSRTHLVCWGIWIAAAGLLLILPLIFRSGTAHTMMSLMGIAIVFALSYNILLGQTGLLSFGHAVYYGLGAYFTVHAINTVIRAGLPIPLPVMPLVGGAAGLVFAALFGWVSTRRSGTAFAMISLGLAELVGSSSLILRSFFGGEEGITTNRTKLLSIFGWTFGPQIQVYYLIAFWCLICAGAMYAITGTPLGRMCNAVRENPERVAFIGYNPQIIRYIAFCLAGFFGGIAGGLAGINFELANSALFSATQSGIVLVAAFVGGAGYFIGPIIGAVLVTYLQTMLSDVTPVWQLYFGLLFVATVMFAPGGLAHLIIMHKPIWRAGRIGRLLPPYLAALSALLLTVAGFVLMIEMAAHLTINAAEGTLMQLLGISIDTRSWQAWVSAIAMCGAGMIGLRRVSKPVAGAWHRQLAAARGKGIAI